MSEARSDTDETQIPEAVAVPRRRRPLPLVWLIPLVAALIGGWLAVRAIVDRGPTVTISFKSAEGLEAGKTKIKYKDVDIGEVKKISLSKDHTHVLVSAELVNGAGDFLVDDTRFWVVRPRIALSGVSGLGTLFSGAYIGVDIGKSTTPRDQFKGLETPPVITGNEPGRQFVLHGEDLGSLDVGSPVYFRRVQVGDVVAYDLDPDGSGVTLRIFVHAPFDRFVNSHTRFWEASGVDFTIGAGGVQVDTQSLASVINGGVAFQTPPNAPETGPAPANTRFELYANRAAASKPPSTVAHTYLLVFRDSVRGLKPGAPVDFRGVVVGEVATIHTHYDPATKRLTVPVTIHIYPQRFDWDADGKPLNQPDEKPLVERLVEDGLRAQLRPENLLTGQLYVALDFFPDAPQATINMARTPPELPTVSGSLQELQAMLGTITKKLEKVPFGKLGTDLRRTLSELNRTLRSVNQLTDRFNTKVAPEMHDTLVNVRRAFGTAQQTLAADAPLQQNLRETLRELTRAAQALRTLADSLERHPDALIRGRQQDSP